MTTDITQYAPAAHMTLDQSIRAWLDEKRADSVRTANAYEETLSDFRETLQSAGLDLDGEPALIAPLAQGWARSSKREGVTVTATTFNQRRSIISSFYKYAITYEVLQITSDYLEEHLSYENPLAAELEEEWGIE